MIRKITDFYREFSKIASQYDWFLDIKTIIIDDKTYEFGYIRGTQDGDCFQVYSPITAHVKSATGRYFAEDRFDLAASLVFMDSQCAILVVDAADEWPDRPSGYEPKPYELKVRNKLLEICSIDKGCQ
jgi:hypothetical protein